MPWKTHLFNFVPLAWALQTAGHQVHVASEPDMIGAIIGAGLTAVPVGSGETMGERVRRAWREGTLTTPEDAPPPGEPAALYALGDDRELLSWQDRHLIPFLSGENPIGSPVRKIWGTSVPGPVQPVLDDRKRQEASAFVWAHVTQGEPRFAPRPIEAGQPEQVRKNWTGRRGNLWHKLARPGRFVHYIELRKLLIEHGDRLASDIDNWWQRPPPPRHIEQIAGPGDN